MRSQNIEHAAVCLASLEKASGVAACPPSCVHYDECRQLTGILTANPRLPLLRVLQQSQEALDAATAFNARYVLEHAGVIAAGWPYCSDRQLDTPTQ